VIRKSNIAGSLRVMFRSLNYRNYRLFFGGQGISLIGTWMQRIAMPWLVYEITGSVFLLGVVSFSGQIPTFILTPLAGVITDRWSKYRVILLANILSMIQAFILAILCLTGTVQLWQIIVLALGLGIVNAFEVPARQSFVVDMVEKKEDLGNAIALNSLIFNGARIIGPSVAGIILATSSAGVCFMINAVSYVFVIISLLMMDRIQKPAKKKEEHVFKELVDGLRYTFGYAPIKHLIILLTVSSLLGMSYSVLMPVFTKEILHGGSHTFGFLMGAAGIGAFLGAIYLASRESFIKLGRIVPFSAMLFGFSLIGLSFSRNFPVSLVLMLFIGLGMMMQTAASNTILQTITDDDKRGRVMGFYSMAIMGTAPFGSLMAGGLAKVLGAPFTILFIGTATVIGAFFFLKELPELKRIVRPVYLIYNNLPPLILLSSLLLKENLTCIF
jgi:MFS family permease